MNQLKREIKLMDDKIVDAYLDQIINQIYNAKLELNFDEWKTWIYSIEGFKYIIEQFCPNYWSH